GRDRGPPVRAAALGRGALRDQRRAGDQRLRARARRRRHAADPVDGRQADLVRRARADPGRPAAAGAQADRGPRAPAGAARRRRLSLRRLVLVLLLALLALPAAVAGAQDAAIQKAAQALQSDPVYVDPQAPAAARVDAGELQRRIDDAGATPTYIAVLPPT